MITGFNETTNKDEKILLNTDTARKDLDKFKEISGEDDEEMEEDEGYVLRQEELIDVDAYENGKINKNISFLVTNDIVASSLIKRLNRWCEDIKKDKNELYTFYNKSTGEEHKINFSFWDEEQACGVFSDVEWVFKYYKPTKSSNLIIDTFSNAIENLSLHLNKLKQAKGNLVFHPENNERIIIEKPEERILFHLPKTNLYYLQTHEFDEPLELDDICITPQMTFSAYSHDIYMIIKQMTSDSLKSIESNTEFSNSRLDLLNRIENGVKQLIDSYNSMADAKYKLVSSNDDENLLLKSIKNYLSLIFYKLFQYYNQFLKRTNVKYFKDILAFNCRHTNYEFYNGLKECVAKLLSKNLREFDSEESKNQMVIKIVRELIVQNDILNDFLVDDIKNVRKNAFQIKNLVDKENKNYGNPYYSLISYLYCFATNFRQLGWHFLCLMLLIINDNEKPYQHQLVQKNKQIESFDKQLSYLLDKEILIHFGIID
jgi:hypothetical protein